MCSYKGKCFYGNTSDEAIAIRDEYKKLLKQYESAPAQATTIKEYAVKFLKSYHHKPALQTIRGAEILMQKFTDAFGEREIDKIIPSELRDFYAETFLGYSLSYIQKAETLYRSFFDSAQEDDLIQKNPARAKTVHMPGAENNSHRFVTDQERKWIETLCTDHPIHPIAMVMLYAGLRPQEAKALNLDKSYDRKKQQLHITDCVHVTGTNEYTITSIGKNEYAERTIPVFPPLQKALEDQSGYLLKKIKDDKISIQTWTSAWESYLNQMEKAINQCPKRWYGRTKKHKELLASGKKLPPWIEFSIVPYDLRTSFCTWLRDNKVELNVCIRWMGHSDSKMILEIYDKVPHERQANEAANLIKNLYSSQNDSQKDDQ